MKKAIVGGLIILALVGCGKNPTGPTGEAGPQGPSGIGQQLSREFPVMISNPEQNSVFNFSFIHANATDGCSQVNAYAKYPGLESHGYRALPTRMRMSDGSITHITYSIDEGKVMFQTYNTAGLTPQTFQAWIVVTNK